MPDTWPTEQDLKPFDEGETLHNGATVEDSTPGKDHLNTVLASHHGCFVVWTHNEQTGGLAHGDYCTRYADALRSYADRIEANS